MPIESFVVKHVEDFIRIQSRSGGIFTALTDIILQNEGIVYGCRLDDDFIAYHDRADTADGRNQFRGSKYIQSNLHNTFKMVKEDLENDKWVLFSGTSCQIMGLKSYCGDSLSRKLYCVDIICHGVPSPKVWKDYLKYCENKYAGKVTQVEFINKRKFGWKAHKETIWVDNVEHDSTIFTHLFRDHNILRPACFECPYKSVEHPGDITIGDAWGVDKANPEFNDNNGVSLVIINTDKGKELFEQACDKVDKIKIDLQCYMQDPLIHPYQKPSTRDKFWRDYRKKGFSYIVSHYVELNLVRRGIRKIKRIIKL